MNYPDVDDIINYLSIKFNKIFIDRDFVCCVIKDFKSLLSNTDKSCVLVFPALGPIYLKAIRYQAKIFDLASFQITYRRLRIVIVCHKDSMKKSNVPELKVKSPKEEMAEVSASRKKRPERQLYVPPAQRRSRQSKVKTSPNNNNNDNSVHEQHPDCCDDVIKKDTINDSEINKDNSDIINSVDLSKSEKKLLSIYDFATILKFMNIPNLIPKINLYSNYFYKTRLIGNLVNNQFNETVVFYNNKQILDSKFEYWWLLEQFKIKNNDVKIFMCNPFFNFNLADCDTKGDIIKGVFDISSYLSFNFDNFLLFKLDELKSGIYQTKYKNTNNCNFENVDLSLFGLGHCFIMSYDGIEYFYQCQENHNADKCVEDKIQDIKNIKLSTNKYESDVKSKTEINFNNSTSTNSESNSKISKNEHEQEKEIMRKIKENINRKTKPIMKYVDDNNDTLTIDKTESINNWEDLFNDDGQIQEELLSEIVEKVGPQVKVVKATEDYTSYTNKPPENLEHIVELYNFPSTLETHDLVSAFRELNSDSMYIKWVDDTHALLVLGSFSQAQKAINMKNPLIKVRPMTAASAISVDVANKSDLRPAMKRPPTNLQTARRLITTHLGAKSKLSKEQIAKERQDLKNAREMKRLIKQSERDAWEGNIKSSLK